MFAKPLPQVIQACGGAVDPTLTSRCTHLLCESQVSSMYVQVMCAIRTLPLLNTADRPNQSESQTLFTNKEFFLVFRCIPVTVNIVRENNLVIFVEYIF